MRNASLFNLACFVFNICLACLFILTIATLIQERSQDIVRITVPSNKLLETVGQVQLATHRVARAYPVGGDSLHAPRWRIVVDRQSRAF